MSHAAVNDDLKFGMTPNPNNVTKPQPFHAIGDRISISASFGAVPWACPEYVSIELDVSRGITVQALGDLINALAGVARAARPADPASEPETLVGR